MAYSMISNFKFEFCMFVCVHSVDIIDSLSKENKRPKCIY